MKVGVTGTRSGMNETQRAAVTRFLQTCGGTELHHGDCVGVDVEVAEIAANLGYRIVCHPPLKDDLRGFFESAEYRRPMTYFQRNREIVKACDHLMVVPWQDEHQTNGGTWYTHDYAMKQGKPLQVFYPDRE